MFPAPYYNRHRYTVHPRPNPIVPDEAEDSSNDHTSMLHRSEEAVAAAEATAVTRGTSRLQLEEVVNGRLNSPWGRPLHPPAGPTSQLHELIEAVQVNHTSHNTLQELAVHEAEGAAAAAAAAVDLVQEREHDRHPVDQAWATVLDRVHSHPQEAAHLDRRGRTALHAACAKRRPPLRVIQALVDACGRHGETIMERDKHGRTPLVLAISSNADYPVIEYLVSVRPQAATVSDHLGQLPLHIACGVFEQQCEKLVELLIQAFPEAASRETFNGRTPLHAAMEARAPLTIVKQLVKLYPQAVVMDGCGLNPLFIAIRFNADADIIRCLVNASPSAPLTRDRGHGLPLRRAIENQSPVAVQECLCTCPEIVLDADPNIHNTALHSAIETGTARLSTIDLLVRVAPQVSNRRNKGGRTPLRMACDRYLRVLSNSRNSHSRNAATADQHDSVQARQLKSQWRMIVPLMRAAWYGQIKSTTTELDFDNTNRSNKDNEYLSDEERQPTLHAAVSLHLPLEIVQRAIAEHGEDLRRRDLAGMLPLHLAIQSRPSADDPIDGRYHAVYLNQKDKMILSVLEACPEAADQIDGNGYLPILLAARATSISPHVLSRLWSLSPQSLVERDPIGLYPFQIAALPKPRLSCTNSVEPWKNREDELQLTAIYTLLRQAPENMRLVDEDDTEDDEFAESMLLIHDKLNAV